MQKGAEGLEAAEHQAGSKRAVRRAAQICDMCKYILILQYYFILHATYSAFYFILHVTLFCMFLYSACSFILHVTLFCMFMGMGNCIMNNQRIAFIKARVSRMVPTYQRRPSNVVSYLQTKFFISQPWYFKLSICDIQLIKFPLKNPIEYHTSRF